MTQHNSNPKRANDLQALPDVETFYVGHARRWNDTLECFRCTGENMSDEQTPHSMHVGWYWEMRQLGCLPDGEPHGPFATEAEALADAQNGNDNLEVLS